MRRMLVIIFLSLGTDTIILPIQKYVKRERRNQMKKI